MQWENRPRLSPGISGGNGSDHPNLETLNAYLDGELAAAEREAVAEHIANCPVCQDELRSLQATVSLVRNLGEIRPPRSFQLSPEDVSDAGAPFRESGRAGPMERPEPHGSSDSTREGDGNNGEEKLFTFPPRMQALATIAAVIAVIVLGAAFLSRLNSDDAPADRGGEMARPAVMATNEATGSGSSLPGDDGLFAGEAVAPSQQPEQRFRTVFGTPRAEGEDVSGRGPTPTLVPLPPPPAVLSDAATRANPSS